MVWDPKQETVDVKRMIIYSFVPILSVYALWRIQKFWLISLISLPISFGMQLLMVFATIPSQNQPVVGILLFLMVLGLYIAICVMLVRHYAQKYNEKIENVGITVESKPVVISRTNDSDDEDAPQPPTSISATIANTATAPLDVTVTWSSPSNVGTGTLSNFQIFRDGTSVGTVGLVNTFSNTVPSSGSYAFTVKAISNHGTSSASSADSITTASVPSQPTLTVTSDDEDDFELCKDTECHLNKGGNILRGHSIKDHGLNIHSEEICSHCYHEEKLHNIDLSQADVNPKLLDSAGRACIGCSKDGLTVLCHNFSSVLKGRKEEESRLEESKRQVEKAERELEEKKKRKEESRNKMEREEKLEESKRQVEEAERELEEKKKRKEESRNNREIEKQIAINEEKIRKMEEESKKLDEED
jgi:hypothetical protein